MPKLTKRSATNPNLNNLTYSSLPDPPSPSIPSFLASPLPKLIVFDLDYTLWPFWVDTHVTPPLKPSPNAPTSAALDRYGESYAFYDDVPSILQSLPRAGVRTAVASRTSAPTLAKSLLKILHLPAQAAEAPSSSDDYYQTRAGKPAVGAKKAVDAFDAGMEIYPSSKIKHFEAIHKRTGVGYEDMLFFDDEARNRDTETLGVTMWLVRDGVTWSEVEKGVREWRRRRGYGG
ncbi:acid phosphatase domain-containing protein [Sarocladium implicatum]|nr:acid phosphatase domain-containing protein [Sarocladium implicatum]